MTQNPAIALYNAWDGLFRLRMQPHQHKYYRDQLPTIDPDEDNFLDDVPYGDRSYYGLDQMLDWSTVFKPSAMLPDGRLFYTMGYQRSGNFQPLFQVSPLGYFRLGSVFVGGWCTRGAYERVSDHTFMRGDKTYNHTYHTWAWWVRGYGSSSYRWLNTRDWRTHTYWWRAHALTPHAWLRLTPVDKTWQARIAPHQEDHQHFTDLLTRHYQQAENYYAKWRRKYYRDEGIPDPEKALDRSDIKTVEYLTQHLRVYDPPKAQMPG